MPNTKSMQFDDTLLKLKSLWVCESKRHRLWFMEMSWEITMPNIPTCCRVHFEYSLSLGVMWSWQKAVAKATGLHGKELSCLLLALEKIQTGSIFLLNSYFSITRSKQKYSCMRHSLYPCLTFSLQSGIQGSYHLLQTLPEKPHSPFYVPHYSQPLNTSGEEVTVPMCLPDSFLAI